MTIKLIPVSTNNPKNTLQVKLEFMHGDADAYTHKTFDIRIPNTDNKELLIGRILEGISTGIDLMDEDGYTTCPFVMDDDDWNETNLDLTTSIPLVGSKVHFVTVIKHKYSTERKIKIGTVIAANNDIVTVEYEGSQYLVPNTEDDIAPEASIAVLVDGLQCTFTVDGVEVQFEGTGDCTRDGDGTAQASFDTVTYFDENGNKFNVTGFYF